MSAIRQYLETKAALPEKEWLRREPRGTSPEILQAVRDALAAGLFYDDDVGRYVNEHAGDLPEWTYHGKEGRDRLTVQLGHECYIARCVLRDEDSSRELAAARADGFETADRLQLVDGARVELRCGTLYSGYSVPVFGPPRAVRLALAPHGWGFIEKGKRTRYYLPDHALIRPGWPKKGGAKQTATAGAL